MTVVPRLPLYALKRSPRRADTTSASAARQHQQPSEYKPPDERLAEAISTCIQLDCELKVLESSGHARIGVFAKPLVKKRDASSAADPDDASASAEILNDSALLDEECADPFYHQFYDDDGRSLFEQLLRGRMRILALAKMVHGRASLRYVRAEVELAEAYARINLWKQGHIHIATASELLKELSAQPTLPQSSARGRSRFARALERLYELQVSSEGSKGHLSLDDAVELLGDCCSGDDDNGSDVSSEAYGACSDVSPLTHNALCAAFGTTQQQLHWQQLLLQLERKSPHFQRYVARLERAAPESALRLVRSHFACLDLAHDGIVPFHTFFARLDAAAKSSQSKSNSSSSSHDDDKYLETLCLSLQLLLERYQHHSLTWSEVVELGSSRQLFDDAVQELWPRLKLFMGRLFLRRGQLDDAVRQVQLALAQQEQLVGTESESLVQFYLVLAEAMAVRFKQLGVVAQQSAFESASKWLESVDGSRALRAKAIEVIDDECARSGAVLPKKEAEARARDALVLAHSTATLVRPDASMVEDAIELCTKAWSLQERHYGREHVSTAVVHVTLAQIYALKSELRESVRYFTKAIEIYEHACNGPVPASAFLRLEVAKLHQQQRESKAARAMYTLVGDFFVSFAQEFASADSTKRACCAQAIDAYRQCLALLAASHGAKDEQRSVLEAIARAARDGYGECSIEASDAARDLGELLLDMGNLRGAETHLRTACYIVESHYGASDRRVRRLRKDVLDVTAKLRASTLHPDEGGNDGDDHAWLTL